MVIVRVVAACPFSWDVVLALSVPTHALQPLKRSTTHFAVVSVDVLPGTAPTHRLQVPWQFAGTREHRRTASAAVTSLWTVPLVSKRLAS